MTEEKLKELGKKAARYGISVLALTLGVVGLSAVADLHDVRIMVGVIAGMALGEPLVELTKKIKGLED